MDLSLQHLLTVPPCNFQQRGSCLGTLGFSSPQIGFMARKLQLRGIRCRVDEGELAEEKPKIGSWSQGTSAATDEFSGWGVNGSQANGANVTGWVKIGGAVLLGIGFSLGARALYARKDAPKMFAVTPPGIETMNPSNINKDSEALNTSRKGESSTIDATKSVEEDRQSNTTNSMSDVHVQEKADIENIGKMVDTTLIPSPEQKEESLEKVDDAIPTLSNSEKVEVEETAASDDTADADIPQFVEATISAKTSTENMPFPIDSEISDNSEEVDLSSLSAVLAEENPLNELIAVLDGREDSMAVLNSTNLSSILEHTENSTQTIETVTSQENEEIPVTESLTSDLESGDSFSSAGMTAPRIPSSRLPKTGQLIVAASADQMQEHVLAALQALKVIETGVEPGSICTRREYARWLIGASAALSRSPSHKVFPAMYIENVTKLAYDDVLPEDPDFPFIQGLAEAGLISSRLIQDDLQQSRSNDEIDSLFSPDSPLTRQDLITWKMALEWKPSFLSLVKGQEKLQETCGFIDIDKIHQEAIPALLVDAAAGEKSIVALAFGYTRRFQPEKPVSKGQVAIALASGEAWEHVSEELARLEADTIAEAAVTAELALEKSAQQEMAAEFQGLLEAEIEKQQMAANSVENMKVELDQLKLELEKENHTLVKERALLDAEKELLSGKKHELDGQALSLSAQKLEVAFEKEKADKLYAEAENEWERIHTLRTELEVEKNALILARTWAEDEARKALAHVKVLDEMKRISPSEESKRQCDEQLFDETINLQTLDQPSTEQTSAASVNGLKTERRDLVQIFVEAVLRLFSFVQHVFYLVKLQLIELGERFGQKFQEVRVDCSDTAVKAWENARTTLPKVVEDMKTTVPTAVVGLTSSIKDGTSKALDGWKEGAEKFVQKIKIS